MKRPKANRAAAAAAQTASVQAAEERSTFGWLAWAGLTLLAVAIGWIAYAPAISGGYVFDDVALTFRSDPNYGARGLRGGFQGVRPLTELSYWLCYQVGGNRPFLQHLASLLLHAGSSVLLGYILLRLLSLASLAEKHRNWIAMLGAGIFLVHPANTEAVAYISSRSEVLSMFFYLGALAVFVGRGEAAISWARAMGVLGCFVLAMLSKEHSLTLPVALVLIDMWVFRLSPLGLAKQGWRLYGLLVGGAALGAAVVLNTLRGAVTAGFGMKDLQWWEYLLTQGRAIALYFRLYVLPVGQSGDYLFPISRSPLDHGAIFFWIAIVAAAIAAIVYRKRAPLASLGILLFLLLLMPTSSILPIQDAAVERRVYLASLGLVIATAGLLGRLTLSKEMLRYGGIALLGILAIGSFQRSMVWASHEAFWNDVIAKNPQSWRANVQIGLTALEQNRCQEAIERFETALPRVADNFASSLHMNYAGALSCVGRNDDAEKEFRLSLSIEDQPATWTQLGIFYARNQRNGEAMEAFNQAIARGPNFPLGWSNRGNLYAREGNCEAAVEDFEHALQLMPSNTTAQRGLAYCRERSGK